MTVVCVDTNWFVLHGLQKKVKKILPDSTVYSCLSPQKALDFAKDHGCDVLITETDFGGEKEEGIQLAYKMKELNPLVNIIFATGGLSRDYAQQVIKIRYSGLLTKPIGIEELTRELGNLRYT